MSYAPVGQVNLTLDPGLLRAVERQPSAQAVAARRSERPEAPRKEGTVADLCQAVWELQSRLQDHPNARLPHPRKSGKTISSAEASELLEHQDISGVCESADPSDPLHPDGEQMYYVVDEWLATMPVTSQPAAVRPSVPWGAWVLGAMVVGGIAYVALKD